MVQSWLVCGGVYLCVVSVVEREWRSGNVLSGNVEGRSGRVSEGVDEGLVVVGNGRGVVGEGGEAKWKWW